MPADVIVLGENTSLYSQLNKGMDQSVLSRQLACAHLVNGRLVVGFRHGVDTGLLFS